MNWVDPAVRLARQNVDTRFVSVWNATRVVPQPLFVHVELALLLPDERPDFVILNVSECQAAHLGIEQFCGRSKTCTTLLGENKGEAHCEPPPAALALCG
jgi:hypothetical protein